MKFFEIAEGLEDQDVGAAFDQGGNLVAEGVACFLERSLAQRLDPDTQRPDRARHPGVEALGGFLGQSGSGEVDFADFVG